MDLTIRLYNPNSDYENLLKLFESEGGEWNDHLNPEYKTALDNSITYVALIEEDLCGYARSLNDSGLFILVMDLLVHKKHRGQSIGKQLMESIQKDYPKLEVFILSDADGYYEKLSYVKEGSIFKVKGS